MDFNDNIENYAFSYGDDEFSNIADGDFSHLRPSVDVGSNTFGLKSEIKAYEARYNYKGERHPIQVGKHNSTKQHGHQDDESALVLTRWYNWEREVDSTELKIRSPHLKKAMKEVIKEYPGINFNAGTGNVTIRNLPKCLFHYRDELEMYGLTLPLGSDAFKHLTLLLKYMWTQLENQYLGYISLVDLNPAAPGLEHADLWMAFRPGDYMCAKLSQGGYMITKLKDMELEGKRSWELCAEFIADNGEEVGYVETYYTIDHYDNYRPFTQLRIFPLQYHRDATNLRLKAVARGKKMMQLRGVHYRMYSGFTKSLGTSRRETFVGQLDEFPLQATTIKSRVMIDAAGFAKECHNNSSLGAMEEHSESLPKFDGTNEYNLTDDHFMICDHRVPGFSLQDKTWCWFEVENIENIDFNTEAFERLLLPQDQKDMIHSLVDVHTNKDLSFDDVIKGKGKGMVFLLHGVPGVGKTLTAESVADRTKRPLYTVSCGELGVDPAAVEKNLKGALNLAASWNAIVLIDEADVFLEQRGLHELDRNGLVSIFLRWMEYYEGILILTTNRVETFDEAFKSRIHLAIKYHPLTPPYRAELWRSFITSTAPREGDTYPWLTEEYLAMIGEENLNGRQIKNTVRTANALAVSAKTPLSPKLVETALSAMRNFELDFSEGRELLENEPSSKRRRIV